ncbi:hypothetical protein [Deinococcus ruber]|uniref:Uncharacterized protein n=1 Tax=Deinococcus ruber TaxID=1848197 RepID=A0A918CB94_9DEIO|nr:hypothetical protein [Deinococcus ruber]GGR15810.1 hypothetical protein GCM10008957_30690 [Deinococcus ruber]
MMQEQQLRQEERTFALGTGVLATALDRHGQCWPVQYSVLTNAGSGNGVLIDASLPVVSRMPRLLALGDVVHERAVGGAVLGYWQFTFHSFTRCQPSIRGVECGRPDVEAVELRVPLVALRDRG